MNETTIVQHVIVLFGSLKVGGVGVDGRCHPQNDAHSERVEVIDHLGGVGVFVGVPDEVVVSSGPSRVEVHGAHADAAVQKAVDKVDLGLLVGLATAQPNPMIMRPYSQKKTNQ